MTGLAGSSDPAFAFAGVGFAEAAATGAGFAGVVRGARVGAVSGTFAVSTGFAASTGLAASTGAGAGFGVAGFAATGFGAARLVVVVLVPVDRAVRRAGFIISASAASSAAFSCGTYCAQAPQNFRLCSSCVCQRLHQKQVLAFLI